MKKIPKLTKEQLMIREYIRTLSVNQRSLHEMILALNQQIICMGMKIRMIERYVYGK